MKYKVKVITSDKRLRPRKPIFFHFDNEEEWKKFWPPSLRRKDRQQTATWFKEGEQ